jgi:D-alanyl-D-alanine dipeptidase
MKRHKALVMVLTVLIITLLINNISWAASTIGKLVNLSLINPRIVIEMKYATADNFLKQPVYIDKKCYVLEKLAYKLDLAQKMLEQDGLGLKVFDGYRPLNVQKQMWALKPDARFVADPSRGGSIHNRGAAVDLTLVDATGKELDMPTPFDSFELRAGQFSMEPTAQQRANRALLRQVMQRVGLEYLKTEWWHYQLPNGKQYPLLNQ